MKERERNNDRGSSASPPGIQLAERREKMCCSFSFYYTPLDINNYKEKKAVINSIAFPNVSVEVITEQRRTYRPTKPETAILRPI